MLRSRVTLSLLILWVVIASVTIQKSHGADLWNIYQLALIEDQTYRAAVFNHQSNRLNLPIAKTGFNPSITATSGFGHRASDASTAGDRNGNAFNLSLNLNIPLYDKFKLLGITQVGYQVDISSLQLLEAKQQLILRVARLYFNLLAAQDTQEVARLEKIVIQRQVDLANERLQVGLGTQTDLFDAKARFSLAEASEIQAQNQINNDLAALKQIIGMSPEALSIMADSAPLKLPVPNDVDDWIKQSGAHNIGIRMETLNLEIALQEINKQQTRKLPKINLDGNASSAGATNMASVAVVVQFPFQLGGVVNLKTRQAALDYNRRERLLEQARRSASTETKLAFLAVTSGVSRVKALFDAITAGESSLQAKKAGFSAGLTTNLDVLDAQRDLSRSRTEYLSAKYNYILAVLKLEMATGQLDEADLKRVNDWLTR